MSNDNVRLFPTKERLEIVVRPETGVIAKAVAIMGALAFLYGALWLFWNAYGRAFVSSNLIGAGDALVQAGELVAGGVK